MLSAFQQISDDLSAYQSVVDAVVAIPSAEPPHNHVNLAVVLKRDIQMTLVTRYFGKE